MSQNADFALESIPGMLLRFRALLEASALVCSPYIIDHSGNTPSHLVDKTFSIDVQTDNAGIYRDVAPLRMRHLVTATVVWTVSPRDMFGSQVACVAREETLIRTVGAQGTTEELRIAWQSTARSLSPAREHLITRIAFRVEHDWYGEPLESEA